MEKNESDIIEQWIIYHSYLFGLNNLHVIDNISTDNTLNILNKYKELGLNTYSYDNYKLKGDFICNLIQKSKCDIAIPLDIDEFIALDIDGKISCNKEDIINEFNKMPYYGRYSFKYYLTSRNTMLFYENPIIDMIYFDKICNIYNNINNNKKFFKKELLLELDHGNHKGIVKNFNDNDCYITDLILFHYHFRSIPKLIEKCINDISGLGLISNINDRRELRDNIRNKSIGSHNMETYLKFLEKGPHSLLKYEYDCIKCNVLSNFFQQLSQLSQLST